MIVLSYNVRGLGNRIKWRAIRDLIVREKIEMVLLQETKVQEVEHSLCNSLWGDSSCDWRMSPAVNSAGGLLCIWNKDAFELLDCTVNQSFIILVGIWGDKHHVIANVYAPCDREGKRAVWRELQQWKQGCTIDSWCIGGDFNAVRAAHERRGEANVLNYGRRDMEEFNEFISQMELLDLPIAGKRFTWYRPNGKSMSRIDRFLISGAWLTYWPESSQLVLGRELSDHCPLLLRSVIRNWGPKPFRTLNCWLQDPRFKGFVEKTWEEIHVQGWGAHVLKEKLKLLKAFLRTWNKEVFGDVRKQKRAIIEDLAKLDKKKEEEGLTEEECLKGKELMGDLWKVSRQNESILYQKARVQWLKEGDRNTKFFHAYVNWR